MYLYRADVLLLQIKFGGLEVLIMSNVNIIHNR